MTTRDIKVVATAYNAAVEQEKQAYKAQREIRAAVYASLKQLVKEHGTITLNEPLLVTTFDKEEVTINKLTYIQPSFPLFPDGRISVNDNEAVPSPVPAQLAILDAAIKATTK